MNGGGLDFPAKGGLALVANGGADFPANGGLEGAANGGRLGRAADNGGLDLARGRTLSRHRRIPSLHLSPVVSGRSTGRWKLAPCQNSERMVASSNAVAAASLQNSRSTRWSGLLSQTLVGARETRKQGTFSNIDCIFQTLGTMETRNDNHRMTIETRHRGRAAEN